MKVALFTAILIGATVRDKIPQYNIDFYCEKVSTFGGGFHSDLYGACLQAETKAYNDLSGKWRFFSPDVRQRCDEFTRGGGMPSYVFLGKCLWQEQVKQTKDRDL